MKTRVLNLGPDGGASSLQVIPVNANNFGVILPLPAKPKGSGVLFEVTTDGSGLPNIVDLDDPPLGVNNLNGDWAGKLVYIQLLNQTVPADTLHVTYNGGSPIFAYDMLTYGAFSQNFDDGARHDLVPINNPDEWCLFRFEGGAFSLDNSAEANEAQPVANPAKLQGVDFAGNSPNVNPWARNGYHFFAVSGADETFTLPPVSTSLSDAIKKGLLRYTFINTQAHNMIIRANAADKIVTGDGLTSSNGGTIQTNGAVNANGIITLVCSADAKANVWYAVEKVGTFTVT